MAVLLVAGATAAAITNYGSQSDPLVTLSYLNDTVKPAIMDELDRKLANASSGGSVNSGESDFTVVTLSKGQVVKCDVGTEIMLRIGSASSYGPDSPRLIDSTTGDAVSSSGSALTKNHMYVVTIVNNGITATSSNTKILIRGSYTIN